MAAKFFTGLPLDGPDPECVLGNAEQALAARPASLQLPKSEVDHSRSAPSDKPRKPRNSRVNVRQPVAISLAPPPRRPDRACDTSPLADLAGLPGVPVAGRRFLTVVFPAASRRASPCLGLPRPWEPPRPGGGQLTYCGKNVT